VISEGTVKFHVKNILRKLQVANRSEATARYLRAQLTGGQLGSAAKPATSIPHSPPASSTTSNRYRPYDQTQARRQDGVRSRSSRTTSVGSRATALRKAAPSGAAAVRSTAQSLDRVAAAASPVSRNRARPCVRSTTAWNSLACSATSSNQRAAASEVP